MEKTMNDIFKKIYLKMSLGLIISFLTGLLMVKVFPVKLLSILSSSISWLILLAIEICLVVWFNKNTFDCNKDNTLPFVIFSIINGITFSSIFLNFNIKLILSAFLITSITFLIFSFFGQRTNKDVAKMNNVLWFILIGVFVALIINIFLMNTVLNFIVSCVSIVLFSIYIFVDNKMVIDYFKSNPNLSEHDLNNISTSFALSLYMDIINLFINILNILSYFDNNN